MADLPADIITDILSRLPVTSILQFRSTSKSWRSLIDSHYFKALHHNRCRKLNSMLILCKDSELYAVILSTPGNAANLNQPLESHGSPVIIVGSCNGLLCIRNVKDDIAIWNPSLRKHWILPYPSTFHRIVPNITSFVVHNGFGFDSFTGDYKLVKIFAFMGASGSKVNLFSCRTNAWKTLPNSPYSIWSLESVIVDHTLHWVARIEISGPQLIVAFNLRFEVFNEVPLPELGNSDYYTLKVSHLEGCLSILVRRDQTTSIDFWVMKRYGSKDSWFKLFTLMESPEMSFLNSLYGAYPLGYYSGMKVLFKTNLYELFWYNLKSKQVSHVINPWPFFQPAIIWMESLVQPPFPSEYYRKQQKRKQEQALECRYKGSKRTLILFV